MELSKYIESRGPDESVSLVIESQQLSFSKNQGPEHLHTECIQTTVDYDPVHMLHNMTRRTVSPAEAERDSVESPSPIIKIDDAPHDDPVSKTPSNYERTSFLNVLHFFFAVKEIFKIRKKAATKPVTMKDLPFLGVQEEVNHKIIALEEAYAKYRSKNSKTSLFWPILRIFWTKLLTIQISVLFYNASKMLFTLFLSQLLQRIEEGDKGEAYKWAGALFAAVFVGIYANHQTFFQGARLVGQLKPALIGMIYRKINKISFYSINQVSIGKIVNIAANDLNSFEYDLTYVFYLILAPFVLAGALGLLWSLFGVYCLPGVGCILIVWPVQARFAKVSEKYAEAKNNVTDERVRLTNEMIENIRLLKIYAWDMEFERLISNSREKEIKLLRKLGYTEYFGGHMLSKLAPAIGTFLIFISYQLSGHTLTTDKVYSAVIMLSFLRGATVYFASVGFKFVVEAKLTFERVRQILDMDELNFGSQSTHEPPRNPQNSVEFCDFTASWGESVAMSQENKPSKRYQLGDITKKFKKGKNNKGKVFQREVRTRRTATYELKALSNINISVEQGTLCCLIGKVGCGKSTLLMSFFNEVPKTTGELRYSGRIAYVEQEVSIYPGSARSNVVFGRPYDQNRYQKVVEACCLEDDFKHFPNGDLTEIGERGVNLSGGQKARISLARAVYSDAEIYLLDDPLSAVDTKVAKNLFRNVIRGILREKTVILATHQVHFAKEAEKIVVLEDGKIKAQGNLREIILQNEALLEIFITAKKRKAARPSAGKALSIENINVPTFVNVEKMKSPMARNEPQDSIKLEQIAEENENENDDDDDDDEDEGGKVERKETKEERGKLVHEENEAANRVSFKTYLYYLKNAGNVFLLLLFFLILASVETLNVLYGWFLGYWSDGMWTANKSMIVLGSIIGGLILALVIRELFFVNISLRASQRIHQRAIKTVVKATVEFFDTNPVGRILNRFSNDMGVLDQGLVSVQNDLLDDSLYFISLLITVWIIIPWLLLPGVVLFAFFGVLIKLGKKAITEGKKLELLTRSPVYSLFSQTLSGVVSIRAYDQRTRFIREFTTLLNTNTRAYNYYYDSARAFGFYCDFFSGIFACAGISILLAFSDLNPSQIGLACSYLISITEYIQWAIRQILMHTMLMSSTARIKSYNDIPQEGALVLPRDKQIARSLENLSSNKILLESNPIALTTNNNENPTWPSKGEIQFNDVYMKYREGTEHILKGISFTIKPGEKIGCVGRTGAGKSSIIQALFRMIELDKTASPHSSIMIDGEDISKLGLHTLRQNISIIPQIPCVFSGSVRRNLDPLNVYTEEQVINALQETGLWDYVKSLPQGLNTEMNNSSSVFSVGQKQLICFARALLQKNKILVLDEATANVDFETDNFIQKLLMEKFKGSTIFTIAHRLSTIANYDKVLVLDQGKVVEFDHPYLLLVRGIRDRSITNSHGVFSSMVLNTGMKHSAVILEIARTSFFKKSDNDDDSSSMNVGSKVLDIKGFSSKVLNDN